MFLLQSGSIMLSGDIVGILVSFASERGRGSGEDK